MKLVNIRQAKAQLSDLLTLVEAGEEVLITRHEKPVANLTSVPRTPHERRPGTWKDTLRIADDFNDELFLGCAGPVACRSQPE